jgi:hypothetical protein
VKILVLILSVAISLFILSGCGDSDGSVDPVPETPPDEIVGFWKLNKIVKDGVDLTDDCTTRTAMTVLETNSFYGKDWDAVLNDCLATEFNGPWVHRTGNLYTFAVHGKEYTQVLNEDTLTADFIHAFDGKHYMLEYIRLP